MKRKMMILLLLCMILASCSGWRAMSEGQKRAEIVRYYHAFSIGLKVAADVAVTIKPELAPAVAVAKTTITTLDMAVASYQQAQIEAQVVYGAAQAANAAVAAVSAPDDGLQSFFDDSTLRTAYPGRTCADADLYGIKCIGLGISLG